MKIVLATQNKDKYTEMSAILSGLPVQLLSLADFPEIGEIEEDGNSLEENAIIKARTIYNKTKLTSCADDTGLEVDILGGKPGVYSARYAGENCSYADNVYKLLQDMENIPEQMRTAKFKTVIALVGDNMELVSEGVVKGMVTTKPKGVGGFGYDPVFYVLDKGKTYSEMKITEKNQISHRAKAIQNMTKLLQSRFPEIFHQKEDIA